MLLYFSKLALMQDIYSQMGKNKIAISLAKGEENVVVTEMVENKDDLEFKDSDCFGEGVFVENIFLNRDDLLKILRDTPGGNKECYIAIVIYINTTKI